MVSAIRSIGETGQLLVADKYDPAVNWADHVDLKSGLPVRNAAYSTQAAGPDHNVKGICPAALGSKDGKPAAYDPKSNLFLVRPITFAWTTNV